jgi:transcriptional regulator with XRE-family HTH domain
MKGSEGPLPLESFGRYLQVIRFEKRISLELVAAQTRIGIRTLEAIEHEDFGRLPSEVFLKGFLRAFAKAVGADGDETMRRYEAHRVLICKTEGIGVGLRRDRLGSTGRLVAALALLAVLVAASITGWHVATRTPSETPPAVAFTASEPMGALPVDRLPSGVPGTPAPGPAEAAGGLKLTITAQENTWVKVVTDQGTPGEYTLRAGQLLKLEARSHFNLLIGNAGAVKLTLNNTPVAVPGKRGEPVNLHLP